MEHKHVLHVVNIAILAILQSMRTLNQIERYESHEPGLKLRKTRDILQTAVVKGSFGRLQARANSHNSKHAFVVKYDEIPKESCSQNFWRNQKTQKIMAHL